MTKKNPSPSTGAKFSEPTRLTCQFHFDDAGFQRVELVPTAGKPGVFATLDAGAEATLEDWDAAYAAAMDELEPEFDAQWRGLDVSQQKAEDVKGGGRAIKWQSEDK